MFSFPLNGGFVRALLGIMRGTPEGERLDDLVEDGRVSSASHVVIVDKPTHDALMIVQEGIRFVCPACYKMTFVHYEDRDLRVIDQSSVDTVEIRETHYYSCCGRPFVLSHLEGRMNMARYRGRPEHLDYAFRRRGSQISNRQAPPEY